MLFCVREKRIEIDDQGRADERHGWREGKL